MLLVEVAETSLAIDRLRKGSLYARAGVADYWVVNLIEEVLEVYRAPVLAPSAFEWKYDSVRVLRRNAIVTPLAAPRGPVSASPRCYREDLSIVSRARSRSVLVGQAPSG